MKMRANLTLFLAGAHAVACQGERHVGTDCCPCAPAGENAGASSSASVAAPFATAAPSGSISVTLVLRPLAYRLRPAGACSDLDGAPGHRPDPAKLEIEASGGDACAAAALATVLVQSLGRPEDYARALALAVAAQNAGVALPPKLCVLFELAGDRPGLAACYETGRQERLALMLAFGDGVPRDLARARRLASSSPPLLREINAVDPGAPRAAIRYCDGDRDNHANRDMYECAIDRLVVRDYAASAGRAAALDMIATDARVDTLRRAFLAYRDVDADRRWHSFLGGSGGISGFCTEGLKTSLHEAYDDILQRLAGLAPPPEASIAELDAAGRELARAEAEAGNSEVQKLLAALFDQEWADAHRRLLMESSHRYREFEDVVAVIAKDRLGAGAERGLRARLHSERIAALGQCPG